MMIMKNACRIEHVAVGLGGKETKRYQSVSLFKSSPKGATKNGDKQKNEKK